MKAIVPLALLVLTAAPACIIVVSDDGVELGNERSWSANSATEVRSVDAFHALTVSSFADVSVRAGEAQSVSLTGPSELLAFVRTQVADGVLTLDVGPGAPNSSRRMRAVITVPALDALALNGSGDVALAGVSGAKLHLAINGSGDMRAGGSIDELLVDVNGSGDASLFGLDARSARVRITGTGDVEVAPREKLDVEVLGSGDVAYRGAPAVTQTMHGSGRVSKR